MNNTYQRNLDVTHNDSQFQEWSDEDLFLEYRLTFDAKMFNELVRRYERELYSYLHHYLGNEVEAEDVFQLSFLQIHRKCDFFEEGRRFRPWLYAVATNQAIDFQRRHNRHRLLSLDQPLSSTHSASKTWSDLLPDEEPAPPELVESKETREQVRDAVEALPESSREVITLIFLNGMKYREAAEKLGIPVGTVKSRVHSALRHLESALPAVTFRT